MNVQSFIETLKEKEITFFTGVPDSQLKALCDYLNKIIPEQNITSANEGNAVAIAAGYYLSSKKVPCVYMQNSGLGNIINPYASLLNSAVYGIPVLFVIGWRGEPDVHDEPQHIFQGKITLNLLRILDIPYLILDKETSRTDLTSNLDCFDKEFSKGKSCAIIVRKDALGNSNDVKYINANTIKREDVIKLITIYSKENIIISTTGKTSRELFEIRENSNQPHKYDFLTVGSMGHSSSIALGIALNKPNSKVWCIDGDGAALMHLGAMTIIGSEKPGNLIHIVINNASHESVGGMPTVADKIHLTDIARACGYEVTYSTGNLDELKIILEEAIQNQKLTFIEVKTAIGSRSNLGRPTTTPIENKEDFMDYLEELN